MNDQSRHCPFCDKPLELATRVRTCESSACRVAYRRHIEFGGRMCRVCGTPLSNIRSPQTAVCEHPACRIRDLRENAVPAQLRCQVCGIVLPPHCRGHGVCDDRECGAIGASRRSADKLRREEARTQQVKAAGAMRRDSQAQPAGVTHPSAFPVLIVPHVAVGLQPSDPARIERVRDRLMSLVRWAMTHPFDVSELPARPAWSSSGSEERSVYRADDIGLEASESEQPIFATGCRLCGGSCCRTGAEHAYLNIGLIRQVIATHPDWTEAEIIEAYMQHAPTMTFDQSCIFHGELGCTLPRDLRSDMCNRWLCGGLQTARNAIQDGQLPQFFIVAVDERDASGSIQAAEFVQGQPLAKVVDAPPSGNA